MTRRAFLIFVTAIIFGLAGCKTDYDKWPIDPGPEVSYVR